MSEGPRKKPRRARGEGSLYRRSSDGMWIGAIQLGYTDDGKIKRATVSAKTQKACLQKLNKLKERLADLGGDLPTAMTVKEWLTYWVEEIAPKKPKTLRFYRTNVYLHLIPALGRHRLDRLQPEHVRQLHKAMLAKTWRGRPISTTTVMHAHRTLVTALEAARKEGRVARNVAELVDAPKRARNEQPALTAEQARTVLKATADDRLSSRWMMALLTGARQGECLGLRWPYVDFDRWTLDLAWQLQRITYRHGCDDIATCTAPHHRRPCPYPCPKAQRRSGRRHSCITADDPRLCPPDCTKHVKACPQRELDVPRDYEHIQLDGGLCLVRPKTQAGKRVIPIPAPLYVSLEQRHAAYERERSGYAVDHGLVWCREDGRPIDPTDDADAWDTVLRAAGVPDVKLHAARHTTSTLLMEAGVDAKIVQAIVGHSDVLTTRGYQHVDLTLARAALERLGQVLQIEAA